MRFDTNSRNSRRDDYEQFVNFLGLNASKSAMSSNVNRLSVNNNYNNQVTNTNNKSLAMVYPVKQNWQRIYDPEIGLQNGTIFEELNLPFYQSSCNKQGTEGCGR